MKKTILCITLAFIGLSNANAQVGIGTTTPDASAALDIEATDKGLLIPTLTETEIQAIANPAEGLMVYNTTKNCLQTFSDIDGALEWDCVSNLGRTPPVSIDEQRTDNGFQGIYFPGEDGVAAYSADNPTFTVTIENTGYSPISLDVQTSSLTINNSGTSSLSVASVSPSGSVNVDGIAGSGELLVTYTLEGTAPAPGETITADVDISGVTYTADLVMPNVAFSYDNLLYSSCTQPVIGGGGYSDWQEGGPSTVNPSNGELSNSIGITNTSPVPTIVSANHVTMGNNPLLNYRIAWGSNTGIDRRRHDYTNGQYISQDLIKPDITSFSYEVVGGGGGGGSATSGLSDHALAGGGGGGAWVSGSNPYNSSNPSFLIERGPGGPSGFSGSDDGLSGGRSQIIYNGSVIARAGGGQGGKGRDADALFGVTRTGAGGAGGDATIGDLQQDGNAGGDGISSPRSSGFGGNGLGSLGGPGGSGLTSEGDGNDGLEAGGGSGAYSYDTGQQSGGNGSGGYVRITFACPPN